MSGAPGEIVWLDGSFLPAEAARISPFDRGFQFGDGVFETMRSEKGRVLYLRNHLERLTGALAAICIHSECVPDWETILDELLRKNALAEQTARIKIVVTRGIAPALGLPEQRKPTVLASARRYDPPPPEAYKKGWDLLVFRDGFSPPMAGFKTLNYLYHLAARQAAVDGGCSEAVILDRSGRVSETSAGSLLARTGGKWWTPACSDQLPGITLGEVGKILEREGSPVTRVPAIPGDLARADTVWVLNSLIGIMPAARIDGCVLRDSASIEAERVRSILFDQG